MVCAFVPNSNSDYPSFMESLGQVLESATTRDSMVLLGQLNAHVGDDSKTWRAVIGRNSLSDLNPSGVQLLDFCVSQSLSITNIMFNHESVHKCTSHQDSLSQQ